MNSLHRHLISFARTCVCVCHSWIYIATHDSTAWKWRGCFASDFVLHCDLTMLSTASWRFFRGTRDLRFSRQPHRRGPGQWPKTMTNHDDDHAPVKTYYHHDGFCWSHWGGPRDQCAFLSSFWSVPKGYETHVDWDVLTVVDGSAMKWCFHETWRLRGSPLPRSCPQRSIHWHLWGHCPI